MKSNRLSLWFKIIFHIFIGIFLGCSITLLHVSSSETFQRFCEQQIKQIFKEKYQCNFECSLESVDYVSGTITFSDVYITPLQPCVNQCNQWSISSDLFTLSYSWWSLCTSFCFKISASFDHMIMYEKFEHEAVGLQDFFKKLFVKYPGDIFIYDALTISHGLLQLEQSCIGGVVCTVPYVCNMSLESDRTRMQFYAKRGSIFYKNQTLISDITGSLVCDFPASNIIQDVYIATNFDMHIAPFLEKGDCVLFGKMASGKGSFFLQNEDHSFIIDPIQIRADSQKCLCDASLTTYAELCKQLGFYEVCKDLYGSLQVDIRTDLYNCLKTLQVDVSVDDVAYKTSKLLQDGKLFMQYQDKNSFCGQLSSIDKQWFNFSIGEKDNLFYTELTNSVAIPLTSTYWAIPVEKLQIMLTRKDVTCIEGYYQVELYNHKLDEKKLASGTIRLCGSNLLVQGKVDDIEYEALLQLSPTLFLEKVLCKKKDKKLFEFYSSVDKRNTVVGTMDFAMIQMLVPESFKHSFSQDGFVTFEGYVKDGIYYSQVTTEHAHIRIPKIYNVIQHITAACEIDMYHKTIRCKDIKAQLHEGEISCSQANVLFDKDLSCLFMHAPLLLHNVMLSWDKGIFMLLSGKLCLHKYVGETFHLNGQMIIEKSQLKDNIFSSNFQEKLFAPALKQQKESLLDTDCSFDVSIFTKDLLQIKTSFLSTKAKVDMLLHGTVKKPDVSGSINLVSGSLNFPYKPLDIVNGKIFFVSGQEFDPLIEAVAKGKLKRYGITMNVSGSIFDPQIQFDANPYLHEEQIVSLLLLGVEDNSLNVMVPALLTQRLKDIVFGPALSKTKLQTRFEKILQALKYFRFLPQFTDQAGRGGMRGIFEVDASEHLHGRIDTNFMQLEDTKFDVDFSLTDEITFRVQKDGPSTYGGEVEFRWKFNS